MLKVAGHTHWVSCAFFVPSRGTLHALLLLSLPPCLLLSCCRVVDRITGHRTSVEFAGMGRVLASSPPPNAVNMNCLAMLPCLSRASLSLLP
ncbi:hypothetical protein J3F83DRAFT_734715 [Trichoderma novae-zelandiae]